MELHRVHKTFHHSHLDEEKHQMLNLNRRLETYLSRVKHLEEENGMLAEEIGALRRSNHGASTRRKGLEEELRRARQDLDGAWSDRVHTELEVGRLTEEFQALDQQRQIEAQAHAKAKAMVEQSRKELEEEQRAQMWLRQKVGQLEHEMRHLIQTHQEDVARLETTLSHSRATMPAMVQRCKQTPNLVQLGQEYCQKATIACQEATEAYQAQLARLEESLNQARNNLTQVNQEKSESQLRLQALEKEITSAQNARLHLEKTAAQQRDTHSQEIQQLQAHMECLEVEREELGEQIDHLHLENQGLLQMKMSLGLEVATYRALLDSKSLRGDICLSNPSRDISITDAAFCPRGVKNIYRSQMSYGHKTTSLSPLLVLTGRAPTAVTATPLCGRKPTTFNAIPKRSKKPAQEDVTKSATWDAPYPKILQDGAVESFRPQAVQEKVTYAEPLSPPNEQEARAQITSGGKEGEVDWNNVDDGTPEETPVAGSAVSHQVESVLSSDDTTFIDEVNYLQCTALNLTPYHFRIAEKSCDFSDESDKEVPFEGPAEKEEVQPSHVPDEALGKKECMAKAVENAQGETSNLETAAALERTVESRTSSPASECEPAEIVFNQWTDLSRDENCSDDDAVEIRQEMSRSTVGTNETEVEDELLYPDGEEMDTWDSVIERKVDLKADNGVKKDEAVKQYAEPDEDISAREHGHEKKGPSQHFTAGVLKDANVATPEIDKQADDDNHCVALYQELVQPAEKGEEEDDEEEDSQNVSVSWRTEVESDSYAQDNTLADTRPLIRYESDETDANAQAVQMDESESSEGDREKNIGEAASATWSEGKSKGFGTMEDLCEEVEQEALGEEYDLGHSDSEDRNVCDSMTVREHVTSVYDTECAEERNKEVGEDYSDEETEESTKPMAPANVDYDVELETDRLVEQELESLSTDSYSAYFTQQQVSGNDKMLLEELASSTKIIDPPDENLCVSDLLVVMPQTETPAEEEVQREDHKAPVAPEKSGEEDEHNVSMLTHADVTEYFSNSVAPDSARQDNLPDVAAPADMKEVAQVEGSESQGERVEDVVACPDVPDTDEWEVQENLRGDSESRDPIEADQECDDVPDSAESPTRDDGGSDEGVTTCEEEQLEITPDSAPDENDFFVVKDSTAPDTLNRNGQDKNLPGVFSSSLRTGLWVSSSEAGATYQPDDAGHDKNNQNQGLGENLVWGKLDKPNVVNGNSLAAQEEQEPKQSEVK